MKKVSWFILCVNLDKLRWPVVNTGLEIAVKVFLDVINIYSPLTLSKANHPL